MSEAFYIHEGKTATVEITIAETPKQAPSLKPFIVGLILGMPIPLLSYFFI